MASEMPNLLWEELTSNHGGYAARAKVFGGWLVKLDYDVCHDMTDAGRGMASGYDHRPAVCFVPDSTHEWEV